MRICIKRMQQRSRHSSTRGFRAVDLYGKIKTGTQPGESGPLGRLNRRVITSHRSCTEARLGGQSQNEPRPGPALLLQRWIRAVDSPVQPLCSKRTTVQGYLAWMALQRAKRSTEAVSGPGVRPVDRGAACWAVMRSLGHPPFRPTLREINAPADTTSDAGFASFKYSILWLLPQPLVGVALVPLPPSLQSRTVTRCCVMCRLSGSCLSLISWRQTHM